MNRDAAYAAVGYDHKLHGHGALPSHAAGLARIFKRGENGLSHFTEKRIPVPAHDEKRRFGGEAGADRAAGAAADAAAAAGIAGTGAATSGA